MIGAFHTQKLANVSNRVFYPPLLPTMPYFIYVSTDLRDLLFSILVKIPLTGGRWVFILVFLLPSFYP